MDKEINKYIWRGDNSMQLRVSYVPARGGVEVVDPNGVTLREKDARNTQEAKAIIKEFCSDIENNNI